ncbi:ABC transporter ATP-binding protein [Aquimarina sp. 2201CG5-10]|uniref:ABC transporter ATP-binding protein n=1 Tax=Aquimarina callyspongiae TaxID=3098150 RepID=UPI002AB4B668|nr:ABC transporter ATP-binding protein [Aquimarina sp. 2201CG5-10]MDY8135643.1 ABC transporter ATP-binding protein [Aquimarina sp. 2201CG5-10]
MIAIENLQFNYPKSKTILNNISLDLTPGNIYGLFGKNGEGKSTLLKIMSGLLYPKTGFCRFLNHDISKRAATCLQDIFIIPEDFELPGLKISTYEQINSVFYPTFSKDQFYQLLKEFNLSSNEKISTLSFGQKKKVLIAFGIATNTKLLLMDEPTNGLDIPSKSQFRKIMAATVDQGKCIVISTHQVRDLHSLINHVIILDQSKLAFNYSLSMVSEHLWFGKPTHASAESIIYSETSFGGKAVLMRRGKNETEVDLELLFNTVLHEPERINYALNKKYNDTII